MGIHSVHPTFPNGFRLRLVPPWKCPVHPHRSWPCSSVSTVLGRYWTQGSAEHPCRVAVGRLLPKRSSPRMDTERAQQPGHARYEGMGRRIPTSLVQGLVFELPMNRPNWAGRDPTFSIGEDPPDVMQQADRERVVDHRHLSRPRPTQLGGPTAASRPPPGRQWRSRVRVRRRRGFRPAHKGALVLRPLTASTAVALHASSCARSAYAAIRWASRCRQPESPARRANGVRVRSGSTGRWHGARERTDPGQRSLAGQNVEKSR